MLSAKIAVIALRRAVTATTVVIIAEKNQTSSARAVGKYAQNVLRMSFAPNAVLCAALV